MYVYVHKVKRLEFGIVAEIQFQIQIPIQIRIQI